MSEANFPHTQRETYGNRKLIKITGIVNVTFLVNPQVPHNHLDIIDSFIVCTRTYTYIYLERERKCVCE